MPTLASFREFLTTGNLGPLSPRLDLRETSAVLGPPEDWVFASGEDRFPLYWIYGDSLGCQLEVNFDPKPPHEMQWFQIDNADVLRQDVHVFGDQLALAMDGFHGGSRPSEFLASRLWDSERVLLQFDPRDLMLVISAGTVQVIFEVPGGDEDVPVGEPRAILADAFGVNASFAEIEHHYRLSSIYAFPRIESAVWPDVTGILRCSGARYLASLAGASPSPVFRPEIPLLKS